MIMLHRIVGGGRGGAGLCPRILLYLPRLYFLKTPVEPIPSYILLCEFFCHVFPYVS